MASETLDDAIEKGKRVGLNKYEVLLMAVVIRWINGHVFDTGSRTLSIGQDNEPSLQTLVEAEEVNWTSECEDAHQRMRDRGLFKTDQSESYVAGQYCRWVPTETFLKLARTVLDEYELIFPDWHRPWRSGAPIFGDGNELLTHRKGVMVAGETLLDLPWVERVSLYPEQSGVKADMTTFPARKDDPNGRVEVLTGNNDRDRWVPKWEAWATTDIPTVWIFSNREAMVNFFNTIIYHPDLTGPDALVLDGGRFGGNPDNWSASKVNDRLKRSRGEDGYQVPSRDLVCTLPSLLEADADTVKQWCITYGVFSVSIDGEDWFVSSGSNTNASETPEIPPTTVEFEISDDDT